MQSLLAIGVDESLLHFEGTECKPIRVGGPVDEALKSTWDTSGTSCHLVPWDTCSLLMAFTITSISLRQKKLNPLDLVKSLWVDYKLFFFVMEHRER